MHALASRAVEDDMNAMNNIALRLRPFVPALLFAASFSLALGVSLPIVRFEKLYFLSETPSIVALVVSLWEEGDLALASVVFLFSFLFPVLKLMIAFQAAFREGRLPAWTSALAKWSMMDVLLVALVVMAAKTSGFADAVAQPGVWFYAASAVAGAVAAGVLRRSRSLSPPAGVLGSDQARNVVEGR